MSPASMNEGPKLGSGNYPANVHNWVSSDFGPFCQLQRILDVHAEVAHRAVYFGMAEEDLNGAEIPRRLVDDRSLRPS
jgi:hypothetical protein